MSRAADPARRKRRKTLTQLIEEAREAGMKVGHVEISPDGHIILSEAKPTAVSAYDRWKGNA
jgi:hypothetical protein